MATEGTGSKTEPQIYHKCVVRQVRATGIWYVSHKKQKLPPGWRRLAYGLIEASFRRLLRSSPSIHRMNATLTGRSPLSVVREKELYGLLIETRKLKKVNHIDAALAGLALREVRV